MTRFTAKHPGLEQPRPAGVFKCDDFRGLYPAMGEPTGFNPNMESSYKGHTVNALVPTGEEGRDKLR